MRLAGTINHKTGQYARVVDADFALPAYRIEELVGDLPDPAAAAAPAARRRARSARRTRTSGSRRPSTSSGSPASRVPRGGLVSCPAPWHDDAHPSCSVGVDATQGWCCHSACCGARGAIYDLASVLLGGPWGRELRGDGVHARSRARAEAFGDADEPAAAEPRDRDRRAAERSTSCGRRTRSTGGSPATTGCAYVSPPQSRDSALALVALLLGGDPATVDGAAAGRGPIAGGRRTSRSRPRPTAPAERRRRCAAALLLRSLTDLHRR